jgi:hypothetical protein
MFKLQQSLCVIFVLPSEMTQVMCVLQLLLSQNKISCITNMVFAESFNNAEVAEGLSRGSM